MLGIIGRLSRLGNGGSSNSTRGHRKNWVGEMHLGNHSRLMLILRRCGAVFVAMLLGILFLMPFFPASGATSLSVTVSSITPATPGTPATYTINVTTSATGALTSGTGTISLQAPFGTLFPPVASDYTVASTASPTPCSTVAISQGGELATITTPIAVGNSSAATIVISGVTNPASSSSYTLRGWSSSDTSPVLSNYYSIGTSVTTVLGPILSSNIGAGSGSYKISFTTSASGELTNGSQITLAFPSGTSVPSVAPDYLVNGISVVSAPVISGTSATITIPPIVSIPNSTSVTVVVLNVINTSISGSYTIGISTSSDIMPVQSPPFLIGTAVLSATLSASTTAVDAANVTWTVSFTSSSSGAVSPGGTVTVTAPPGTILGTSAVDYSVSATGSAVASAVNVSGTTVIISLPSGVTIGSSSTVTVGLGGLTNPTTPNPGAIAFVSTSSDTAPTAMPAPIQSAVSSVAIYPSNTLASSLAYSVISNYEIDFIPTSPVGPGGTVTICAQTSSYTLPSTPASYSMGQTSGISHAPVATVTAAACPTGYAGYQITVPSVLNGGHGLVPAFDTSIVIAGITNPASGNYSFFVQTTSDPGLVFSNFTIAAQPTNSVLGAVISMTSNSLSAGNTFTATFNTPAAIPTGGTISVTLPSTATIPTAIGDYSINGTTCSISGTTCSGVSVSGSTVTLTVGSTPIGANTSVNVALGNGSTITNPSTAGNYLATISTSIDTASVSTNGFVIGVTTTTASSPGGGGPYPPTVGASAFYEIYATASPAGMLYAQASPAETITISNNDTSASNPFPATTSDYLVDGVMVSTAPLLGGASGDWTVTIFLPAGVNVAPSCQFFVDIAGVANPSTVGSIDLGVVTSADADSGAIAVTSQPYFGSATAPTPTAVSSVSVSPSFPLVAAVASYSVGFTTSSTGSMGIGSGITIQGPALFPSAAGDYVVNGVVVSSVSPTSGNSGVNIMVPTSIGTSTPVTVTISNVTNPPVPGSYSLSVYTSSDNMPVASSAYAISTGVGGVLGPFPDSAQVSSTSTYSMDFITSPAGALSPGSSTVMITAASGTTFPSVASDYSVNGIAVTTVAASSNTATITVPTGIPGNARVSISVVGVTNPPSAGFGQNWSISTSSDTVPIAGPAYSIDTAVTSVSASPASLVAGYITNYTVSFTPTTSLVGGIGTVTFAFAQGTLAPTVASNYVINGIPAASISTVGNPGEPMAVTATLASSDSLPTGTPASAVISAVGNPPQFSPSYSLEVWTSGDLAPSAGTPFTLSAPPAPSVTAISPAGGSTGGGSTVSITGTDFTDNSIVYFGEYPSTQVTDITSTSLTAVSPGEPAGTYDIEVSNKDGTSTASSADLFTVTAPPPPTTSAYSLTLTPSASTLNPGAQVTFSASLTETSTNSSTGAVTTTPISGTSVSFDVSSGPDAGLTFSGTTNSSGIATYVFTNKGGSGVDTVTAGTTPTGTTTPVVASATVTFTGLSSLTLSPASQGAVVGQSVIVSGLALDPSGAPLVGASVVFSVSSGPDIGISSTLTTNTKGVANFTLASPKAGIDQISATLSNSTTPSAPTPSSSVSSNQVTVTWAQS